MNVIKGDLLQLAMDGRFDVIIHGCNCFHTMRAGIAKTIATLFPEAVEADKATPYGDKAKLGTISVADITRSDLTFTIVNAYTQFHFRGKGPKVDYDAVSSCFTEIAARFQNHRIGYPMIGAGLAGGNWDEISKRIDECLEGSDHCLVQLPAGNAV